MISLSALQFLLLAELLLLFAAVAIGLGTMAVLKKRRERRAVGKLVARIKATEQSRSSETRELLATKFGLAGEALEQLVNRIDLEEKKLYQTLINLFLKRDSEQLEKLQVECEGVSEPYRGMEFTPPAPVAEAAADDVVVSDLSVELDMLREENERLTTELGVTMDTMGKMLNEYASMYGGGANEALDKAKMIETFQQDESADARRTDDTNPQPVEDETPDVEAAAVGGAVDETVVIDPQEIDAIVGDLTVVDEETARPELENDETLLIEVEDDEFEELEEIDDETELIDLADEELKDTVAAN